MTDIIPCRMLAGRKFLLVAAGCILLATPVALARANHSRVAPQIATSDTKPIVFDVVSIKLNPSGAPSGQLSLTEEGTSFIATNVTMRRIIEFAFNFRRDDLVLDAPNWARSERYDVIAKIAGQDIAAYRDLTDPQRRLMLQAVFTERCKMQAHQEKREMPIYAMTIAKTGSKLKEAKPHDSYPDAPNGPNGLPIQGEGLFHLGPTRLAGHATSMAELVLALSGPAAGRQVVDQTGLTGKYDFMLRWASEPGFDSAMPGPASQPGVASPSESSDPSLFTALQEQLGLRLDSAKGLVDVLVIDHLEKPSEN